MSLIGRNSRVLARMSRNYATYDSSKYRNPNGTMTAAAIRARRPYAVKNAILGGGILAFAGFCYWWAFTSFTPDDFSDVPVPHLSEEELQKLRVKYGLDKK